MKAHPRTRKVNAAHRAISEALSKLWDEHDLTMVEMFQALNAWQAGELRSALRGERHPDDPDKGADEA